MTGRSGSVTPVSTRDRYRPMSAEDRARLNAAADADTTPLILYPHPRQGSSHGPAHLRTDRIRTPLPMPPDGETP